MSDKRRKYLNKRDVMELAEFLTPAKENSDEILEGRTSGSMAWRLARGEISTVQPSNYVWKPTPLEVLATLHYFELYFMLEYLLF